MSDKDNMDIDIALSNNDALADGVSKIAVTATLTKYDVPVQTTYDLYFVLEESTNAFFTDTNTKDTNGETVAGSVTKYVCSNVAEEMVINVNIRFNDNSLLSKDKYITFSEALPDKVTLKLTPNILEAGGTTNCTATATAMLDGKVLSGAKINFSLTPESGGYYKFVNTDNMHTFVNTNDKGIATVDITDVAWQSCTVFAGMETSNYDKPHDTKDLTFTVPKNINIAITDTRATINNLQVSTSRAPASKSTIFNAVVKVTQDNKTWVNGGDVRFELQGDSNLGAEFKHRPGDDLDDANDLRTADSQIQPDGIAISDTYFDIKIETGTLVASIPSDVEGGYSPNDNVSFEFVDPWTSVKYITANFYAGAPAAFIYSNGLHQAPLSVALTLSDMYGDALTEENQPTIEDVIKNVKLIDYVTGHELGSNALKDWSYSLVKTDYCVQYGAERSPLSSVAPPFMIKDADLYGNRIEAGIAYITYYITSTDTISSLSIGFSITPTGYVLQAAGGMKNDVKLGECVNAPPQNVTTGNNSVYSVIASIVLLKKMVYNNASYFNVYSERKPTPNQYDNRPADLSKLDHMDNFWRHWLYTLSLADDTSKAYISKSILSLKSLENFRTVAAGNSLYQYNAFLWNDNLELEDGTKLDDSKHIMSVFRTNDVNANFTAHECNIYFSLFIAFTGMQSPNSTDFDLYITIYDQYGNLGYIKPTNELPNKYDPDAFNTWQPFQFLNTKPTNITPYLNLDYNIVEGNPAYIQKSAKNIFSINDGTFVSIANVMQISTLYWYCGGRIKDEDMYNRYVGCGEKNSFSYLCINSLYDKYSNFPDSNYACTARWGVFINNVNPKVYNGELYYHVFLSSTNDTSVAKPTAYCQLEDYATTTSTQKLYPPSPLIFCPAWLKEGFAIFCAEAFSGETGYLCAIDAGDEAYRRIIVTSCINYDDGSFVWYIS